MTGEEAYLSLSSKYQDGQTSEKGFERMKLKLVERGRRLPTVLFESEGSLLQVNQINIERHWKKGENFSKSLK